jgi:hypothetical protein
MAEDSVGSQRAPQLTAQWSRAANFQLEIYLGHPSAGWLPIAADGLLIMFRQEPAQAKSIGPCPSCSCRCALAAAALQSFELQYSHAYSSDTSDCQQGRIITACLQGSIAGKASNTAEHAQAHLLVWTYQPAVIATQFCILLNALTPSMC